MQESTRMLKRPSEWPINERSAKNEFNLKAISAGNRPPILEMLTSQHA